MGIIALAVDGLERADEAIGDEAEALQGMPCDAGAVPDNGELDFLDCYSSFTGRKSGEVVTSAFPDRLFLSYRRCLRLIT